MGLSVPNQPDIREFEHSDVIKGVFYTCDLLGDDVAMTKAEVGILLLWTNHFFLDISQDGIIFIMMDAV